MRTCRARLVGPAIMAVAAAFFVVALGMAQQGGRGGAGGTPTTPGKGTPTPTTTPNQTTTTPRNDTPQAPRTIWLSGRVMMYDGTAPPESVTIERVCSANSVHSEGYTDSQGRFSFNMGQNAGIFADASTSIFPDITQQGGFNSTSGGNSLGGGAANANTESALWDCEIRARLPGYRSSTVSLAGRRSLDNPDVGVILLHPPAGVQALTAT